MITIRPSVFLTFDENKKISLFFSKNFENFDENFSNKKILVIFHHHLFTFTEMRWPKKENSINFFILVCFGDLKNYDFFWEIFLKNLNLNLRNFRLLLQDFTQVSMGWRMEGGLKSLKQNSEKIVLKK